MPSPFALSIPDAVERIRLVNEQVNAYVSTRLDDALAQADEAVAPTDARPLSGVPYGLKDEWDTRCLPTTGGSYRHRHRAPATDGEVFRAFDDAGAVLVGKTNLSDLGLAPEATNFIVGPTRNPWDPSRTGGGSSGGAAAAVAAGMQAFDWGTDIGGSIRQPAAFCGVLGLRLSSETWPIAASFPTVPPALDWLCGQGPITRTIAGMRAVLAAAAPRLRSAAHRPFEPRRVVLYHPRNLGSWPSFVDDVTPHLLAALQLPVEPARGLPDGTQVRTIYSALWASHFESLLHADPSLPLGEGLRAVASALLLRGKTGDRRLHPHCAEILGLVALGRVTIFRHPARARHNALALRDQFRERWDQGDLIVSPVSTNPAPKHGAGNKDHNSVMCCTGAGNLADATGLSIPFGRFGRLPRALQLQGPPGSEDALLDLADRLIASRDSDPRLIPLPWP